MGKFVAQIDHTELTVRWLEVVPGLVEKLRAYAGDHPNDYRNVGADAIQALMAERTSLIETKREQIERLESELDLVAGQMRYIAKSNANNYDRAAAAEARLAQAEEVLRRLLRSEYESEEPGLCDCIDNTGKPYQSQFLATAIADAERTFLKEKGQ